MVESEPEDLNTRSAGPSRKRGAAAAGGKRKRKTNDEGLAPKKARTNKKAMRPATEDELATVSAVTETDATRTDDETLWKICERCASQISEGECTGSICQHGSLWV